MAFDPVPWVIGGGAMISDETARVFANTATRDSQGVLLPGNLKVSALGTPGGAVQIAPGAAVVRNQQAPGQSYIGRAGTSTQVSINPTGSGGGRTDLIVGRVIDPDFSPWQPYTNPEEIANGPYWQPHVITGVSAGTTKASQVVTYSAVELARVTLPANTSTVTSGMITDLRSLAQPREHTETFMTGFTQQFPTPAVSGSFLDWPSYWPMVSVPTWATWVTVLTTMAGVLAPPVLTDMQIRTLFNNRPSANQIVDIDNAGLAGIAYTRETFIVALGMTVGSEAGTNVQIKLQAQNTRGELIISHGTHMVHQVTFYETVV